MATGQLGPLLRRLRRLVRARPEDTQNDRQLLEKFAAHGDDVCFSALVERHGRLVLGVCQRILGNEHDAADAFQATFLVLARKAGAVRWQDSVGNWLYGVARRIASKARAGQERRRKHERVMGTLQVENGDGNCVAQAVAPDTDPPMEAARREACRVLDEELSQLPRKYQAPLVLCYLGGKTNEEAARELGWPAGSISRHLTRARELLRKRLVRRGIALSAGALDILLVEQGQAAALPCRLAESTLEAALLFVKGPAVVAGSLSSHAISLAEGALRTMMLVKLKIALALLLTLGVVGAGTSTFFLQAGSDQLLHAQKEGVSPQQKAPSPKGAPATTKKLAASVEARQKPPGAGQLDLSESLAELMHEKLTKPVALDKGIDRNTPLKDVAEFLGDRYDVTILIDDATFKADEVNDDIGMAPIGLPRMAGVKLETILQLVTEQVGGAYLVKEGYIEITPRQRARPEDWITNRSLPPLVTIGFKRVPVDSALQKLTAMTGISVIVDARALAGVNADQTRVTATLNNVPLDTAVRLLADMNGLGVVAIDSVLYVTDKAKADTLEKEQSARRQKIAEREKKTAEAKKESKKAKK